MSDISKHNLADKLALFSEQWTPKIIGELNGQHVKLAKIEGEFVWHAHEHEDELFYVLHGEMNIEFRDKTIHLKTGEMCIVPRGVEHRPVAKKEAHILLFEPVTTVNTGNADDERTLVNLERI